MSPNLLILTAAFFLAMVRFSRDPIEPQAEGASVPVEQLEPRSQP